MGNRAALGAGIAGLTVLIVGALVGVVVGNSGSDHELGSLPTEITGRERIKPIPPVPSSIGVPPLKTMPKLAQTTDELGEPEPPYEGVYTPEDEYVPSAKEKTPYVPAPEPAPEVTVGKSE